VIKVLHITAHLGGGVGRILSQLAHYRESQESHLQTTIATLEESEQSQYIERIKDTNTALHLSPSKLQLDKLISATDIIQIEWWNHPLMMAWLAEYGSQLTKHLVIWNHVSGCHYPLTPPLLLELPDAFLFTAPISELSLTTHVPSGHHHTLFETIHSTGGFDDLTFQINDDHAVPSIYTYMGTLNPAKLHPEIIEYIAAIKTDHFKLNFYGSPCLEFPIEQLAIQNKIHDRIVLHGYTSKPQQVLSNTDVFIYLLNPEHYGTTENVLLEAMASGAVPIVCNNPVEASIVTHNQTGIIINKPSELAEAIEFFKHNPAERIRMAQNAHQEVLKKYSIAHSSTQLDVVYEKCLHAPLKSYDFISTFGQQPHQWYASCLGAMRRIFDDPTGTHYRSDRLQHPVLYERSKSSVFHFLRYFPNDSILKKWGQLLEADHASTSHS
jgi:L-malate glycosyltransferase